MVGGEPQPLGGAPALEHALQLRRRARRRRRHDRRLDVARILLIVYHRPHREAEPRRAPPRRVLWVGGDERLAALGFLNWFYTIAFSSQFYTVLENKVPGSTFN